MTSTAAATAANDNSAWGATQTPSVEQFETTAKQIGTLMDSVRETTGDAQPTPGQAVPATTRKQVTFTHRDTGQPVTFACMPGCIFDHRDDAGTPTHPSDIWCQTERTDVTLPINQNGKPEEFLVLGITLNVRPWDAKVSQRLPHASIEVIDDCWIEDLDPDALAHVIATLATRLDVLKDAHAQLVELRDGYEVSP